MNLTDEVLLDLRTYWDPKLRENQDIGWERQKNASEDLLAYFEVLQAQEKKEKTETNGTSRVDRLLNAIAMEFAYCETAAAWQRGRLISSVERKAIKVFLYHWPRCFPQYFQALCDMNGTRRLSNKHTESMQSGDSSGQGGSTIPPGSSEPPGFGRPSQSTASIADLRDTWSKLTGF
jgi:hypothetical protein